MKPIRIQRSRKHKQISPNGLEIKYVGRPTKWGNPFRVEKLYDGMFGVKTSDPDCVEILIKNCRGAYPTKSEAISDAVECFKIYVKGNSFKELKGKNLSCWCALDEKCHADVLLELCNDSNESV